ncbi:hypothetical protein JW898_03215 [Candidatus Woesearchaeota archaeon]|nr:hypothetical protein [Candidatus Woesearchaeota archaeon]
MLIKSRLTGVWIYLSLKTAAERMRGVCSLSQYGGIIARTALDIAAIKLWPAEGPFLWASGYYMPIYNDNRRFLSSRTHRVVIAGALETMLLRAGMKADMIAGTSTAGIAPAATLAQLLCLPLVIQHEGRAYVFDAQVLEHLSMRNGITENDDIIASTCPFAIPVAVYDANQTNLPFAYVRSEKKDHGTKEQVEGIVADGQRAFLIDYHSGEGYFGVASAALAERGVKVNSAWSDDISDLVRPADVSGKRIVQVEDLVSTGGSCVKEIQRYREMGADVTNCLAIFSYGLDAALAGFRDAGVELMPALTYDLLIKTAVDRGYVPKASMDALDEWRADPFSWGERQGYPPKRKV